MTVPVRNSLFPVVIGVVLGLISPSHLSAQQASLGSIIGHVRVARGDMPSQRVLVSLELRGAPMDSTYTDSSGTFGFHNLNPNAYYVVIADEHYETFRRQVVIDPLMLAPAMIIEVILIPKGSAKAASETSTEAGGANPDMVDVREYTKRFPKPAVKEFQRGLGADASGRRDDAIRHYQKAVAIAPDFYLAHNNLGSDYLSKSDFQNARREFDRVVQLNQSDAAGYFNLSNVCMLQGNLPEAKQFLDEGLRRQPDSALGQFLLGSLNLRQNRPVEAESALRRAIQLSPIMAQARLQLVNLLLQEGRREDATKQLRDFLAAFPDGSFSAQAKRVLQRLESSNQPTSAIPN